MNKKNLDIRERLKQQDVKQWQLAEYLDITESELSRMFRKELDQETKDKILTKIDGVRREMFQSELR